jgi:Uma2 family endonuclease
VTTFFDRHRDFIDLMRRTSPEGAKIEWSNDTLIMQASPSNIHQLNLSLLRRQFDRHAPAGHVDTGNTDLQSPHLGVLRNPDLTYLPASAMATTDNTAPADLALIAVEIVSPSNPENDWVGKLRDYPLMGIPLYLLVDARQKTVTLFSEPDGGKYHTRTDHDFGESVRIPAPFDFDLDTSGLTPY